MAQLSLNLIASQTSLPAAAEPRVVYALLEAAAASAEAGATPTHCCLVVDCSPSMRVPVADIEMFRELMSRGVANEVMLDGLPVWKITGGIPDDLKGRAQSPSQWVVRAVGGAAERLGSADRISLVAFASQSEPLAMHEDVARLTGLTAMIRQLERRDFGPDTRLTPALRTVLDLMREHSAPGRTNRVLLLTDGFVEDEAASLALAQEFGAAHIPISTLGLGIEFQESLLLALADQSGGTAAMARQAADIPAWLERELGRAGRVLATRVRLDLRLAQGVELRRIYRVRPILADLPVPALAGRAGSLPLGNLERVAGQAVLLELLVPAHASGDFRLLRASLHADHPHGTPLAPASSDMVVRYGAGPADPISPLLQPILDRVAAWRLQTRALDAATQGDAAGATRQLEAAVTRLIDLGEHDLAAQTAATAQQLADTGAIEAGAAKELRYATRRLTTGE